jgi:hypothetical protein
MNATMTDTGRTGLAACPTCGGLECLERPRFFAGQTLTEAELNADQRYAAAKSRLHNRYLHGAGVVCGLEVACDDCEGWVVVRPGYALDPCGNDVVVCDQQRVNVASLIAKCRDAEVRRRLDCDPIRPSGDDGCRPPSQRWCLTIAYTEREARASTVLRVDDRYAAACTCRSTCTCGHNGNHNGNGHARNRTVGACEPTRVVEGFRFDVCQAPPGPCRDPKAELEQTLFWKVVSCYDDYRGFLAQRLPSRSFQPILAAAFTREVAGEPPQLYDAYCRLRQALYELDARQPLPVSCTLATTLDHVTLQPPPAEGDTETWRQQAQAALQQLVAVLFQSFVDCVCAALQPPCPPEATDHRLILACMDVTEGRVVRICNACRRYAGAFPSLGHWLSLVPVGPLLGAAVEWLCCQPWIDDDRPRGNRLFDLVNALDPSVRRSQLYESDFASLRRIVEGLSRLPGNLTAQRIGTVLWEPARFRAVVRELFRPEQ